MHLISHSDLGFNGTISFNRGAGLILVVDDEPSILQVCRKLLERSGFRVVTTTSGAEALDFFSLNPAEVSLIITDIMMPGMDGVTLLAKLRRIRPAICSIAISGLFEMGDREKIGELKAAGFGSVLSKPFSCTELLTVINAELQRSGMRV